MGKQQIYIPATGPLKFSEFKTAFLKVRPIGSSFPWISTVFAVKASILLIGTMYDL